MFFKDYFKAFKTIYNTRGSEKNFKSFYFNGSKLFNNIPNEMKDFNSVLIFKTRILEFIDYKLFNYF